MRIDLVELVTAIEEAFHVRLADAEVDRITTIGELHSLLAGKLTGPWSSTELWQQLCTMISIQTGAARAEITPRTKVS